MLIVSQVRCWGEGCERGPQRVPGAPCPRGRVDAESAASRDPGGACESARGASGAGEPRSGWTRAGWDRRAFRVKARGAGGPVR